MPAEDSRNESRYSKRRSERERNRMLNNFEKKKNECFPKISKDFFPSKLEQHGILPRTVSLGSLPSAHVQPQAEPMPIEEENVKQL